MGAQVLGLVDEAQLVLKSAFGGRSFSDFIFSSGQCESTVGTQFTGGERFFTDGEMGSNPRTHHVEGTPWAVGLGVTTLREKKKKKPQLYVEDVVADGRGKSRHDGCPSPR